MMEYGTGWLGREPAPWDRHRWRLNLRGDSEGSGGGGGSGGGSGSGGGGSGGGSGSGSGNTEETRNTYPAFGRTGGFDMAGLDSITANRQTCASLNFRRQPFQNFDIPGGQGPGAGGEFGRGCLLPGFAANSAENRENFQRNFFSAVNKDDFSERNPAGRPFGQRDPVTSFCADRDPTFRTTTAMIRFGQNFATQELNSRAEHPQDGASASGDRSAPPFGRRVPSSPRFPGPSQFDVAGNRQAGLADTFNFSGLPVDPWLPSGTAATAPPDWRAGPGGTQDFQPPAAGAQMYSASMALQRMSSQQSRKRPWQQLLSVVGRRNSSDLPIDPDLSVPSDVPAGDGGVGSGGGSGQVAGPVFTTKARQGRKQSKPLKHEGTADQHVEDDMILTPDSFTQNNHDAPTAAPSANNASSTTKHASVLEEDRKLDPKQEKEDQLDNDVFTESIKSEIADEKEAEVEEQVIETYGDYHEMPLRAEELRTLFPLTLRYGEAIKEDEASGWPRESVVLSTVEVQKSDTKVRYCYIARSNDGKQHPEVTTIDKIRAIEVDTDVTLKVTFVMNYTPCFYCAATILSYFFDIKSRRINIAMELKFSNLHRVHMYPCAAPTELQTEIDRNIDGLQTLHMNGVGLQTFSGVESWYENLLNTDFLHAECKQRVQEIVEIVESDARKEREERDEEDLCNILGL